MALSDFFRINFPYGVKKNSDGKWFAFNREYMPVGWNSKENSDSFYKEGGTYSDIPVFTKYKGLTETVIQKIIKDPSRIQRNKAGEIEMVFFYDDRTNPQSSPEYWHDYLYIIKAFSKLEVSRK